jgi:hypothetical protein
MLLPGWLRAADLDLPTLLTRVARPAPATTAFVEVRYSRLLKTPLAVAGTLERGADGSLVRRIESPYAETTEVRGNDVVVVREGSKPRRFSLDRAPELQGLLGSIGGMLRGDASLLDRSFVSSLEGTDARWHVRLRPHDPRLQRKLSDISVYGSGADTRCFAMYQPNGDASIVALGAAAAADVPHARRDELEAWCRDGRRP